MRGAITLLARMHVWSDILFVLAATVACLRRICHYPATISILCRCFLRSALARMHVWSEILIILLRSAQAHTTRA